jgi:cysteine desulfurase/selenocysteine lyase
LGAAIDYLEKFGMAAIEDHEQMLTQYALSEMKKIAGLKILGPDSANNRGGVISFTMEGIHPHDVGQALDDRGVAVRTGHHCAWPLMKRFGIVGTTRASFYLYNSREDVDSLVSSIEETKSFFQSKGL